MKKQITRSVIIVGAALSLAGCAHRVENKKLDSALSAEKTPASNADLRAKADADIRASSALSDEEKTTLLAIKAQLQKDMDANKEESLELRALFVKNLTSEKYDLKQMALIKKRLKDNSSHYSKILIKALEDAAKAIGKRTTEKSDMLNDYFGARGSLDIRD